MSMPAWTGLHTLVWLLRGEGYLLYRWKWKFTYSPENGQEKTGNMDRRLEHSFPEVSCGLTQGAVQTWLLQLIPSSCPAPVYATSRWIVTNRESSGDVEEYPGPHLSEVSCPLVENCWSMTCQTACGWHNLRTISCGVETLESAG